MVHEEEYSIGSVSGEIDQTDQRGERAKWRDQLGDSCNTRK